LETKGANLAQKEDLTELTTIVNEVKSKFEADSAILKAKLDVASGTALNLKDEERKAVIALNERYFKWMSMVRGALIFSSVTEIDNHENSISEAFNEMVYCEAAFILFIGKNKMSFEYMRLKVESIDAFIQARIKTISNIKGNLYSLRSPVKSEDDYKFNQRYWNEITRHVEEFGALVLDKNLTISAKELQFQLNCRKFLYAGS
jgi:hypothetical protein